MSETPEESEEVLDDPSMYSDESEQDTGDISLLDGVIAEPDEDLEGIEFEDGEEDAGGSDSDLGQDASGNPSAPIPGPLEPVESWLDVDEDGVYQELVPEAEEPVDEPEELLAEVPEIYEEDENEPESLGPEWAQYELWGRDRDAGVEWQLLSTQDYGQDAEAEIEGLRTGTRMEFRVRLVSTDNVMSEWSDVFYYSLPSDLTPPPAPTAPTADDNSGFITHSHDGSLVGAVPDDMSHRVLFAQQMEPSIGDPIRIAEWPGTGAGTITTGRYLDRVAHRAWLIAVDTTGNESDRSEYVEFVPSQPVDSQRINDELRSLDDRVGAGFEESLTEAIANADERISKLAVGELFVENALKATIIDVEDLAANEARMNELWAGLAFFSEAQIDNLLTNTATAKTINAPLIQSHTQSNRGWKLKPSGEIETYPAGGGARQFHVGSDGQIKARGADIEGVLTARADPKSGVRLSSGPITYREGFNTGESWELSYRNKTVTGPYLKWLRDDVPENESPTLVWDEDGNLVVAPYQSSTGTGAFMVQGPLAAQRLIVEGNARVLGNLQAFGTIGNYQSINFPNSYTPNRPCFYRRLGNLIFLAGAVNSNVNGNFGGNMAQVPAPASTTRLMAHRTNDSGQWASMPLNIGTNGWMSVPGGSGISSGTPMSLDGLSYIAG